VHQYADWLEAGLSRCRTWQADGRGELHYLLKRVLLLPFDAHDVAHLGEIRAHPLSRARGDAQGSSLASPDPSRAKQRAKDERSFSLRTSRA